MNLILWRHFNGKISGSRLILHIRSHDFHHCFRGNTFNKKVQLIHIGGKLEIGIRLHIFLKKIFRETG